MLSGRPRVRTLPVPEFSTREALSYLMGRLTADPDQRLGAIDLVVALGCEPPALAQASAMIATSRLTCREYQSHFDHRRAQLAKTTAGANSAAAVTWTLSVEHAERLSPGGGAQYLLALAALLDGHAIPSAVFTALATCEYLGEGGGGSPVDPNVAWSALLSLERAGLLTVDSAATPPTVRMTPTVQTAIRTATTKDVFERAAQAAADALLEVWPTDENQPWIAAHLRSCAVGLQEVAGDALWVEGSCHPLLVRAGRSMDGARLTGPAVAYWRELAATSDRIAGPSSPDTLMAGSQLTAALMVAGQAAEAVAWAQWVVAGRSRVLGPDDPSTIAARIALGHAFIAAGQAEAAVPVLESAVGDCERLLGADSLDTLRARDELAAALSAAGRPDDAIALQRRTLSDHERIQGPRHPDTMTARQKLADTYLASGRVKDAISQLKRVLADRERVLGTDHMDTIVARGILASAYLSAGKMASALALYEQACEGYARVLGPDDPQTLERRANLATVYFKAGRLTDATRLIHDTVERSEQVLPPDDPLLRNLRERLSEIIGELSVAASPDRGQCGRQAARRMSCRPFPETRRASSSRRSRGAGVPSIRYLPDPVAPAAQCGVRLVVTGADGQPTAVGACEHWEGGPDELDLAWGAARRFQLTAWAAGPDMAAALDRLLSRWRDHLASLPEAGLPDTAAVVTWPCRDIGGIATLVRHGLAPFGVVAARTTGRRPDRTGPADDGAEGTSTAGTEHQDLQIRRATPADIDTVVRLGMEVIRFDAHFAGVIERPSTAAALRREAAGLLAGPECWTWLAERDDTVIGMVAAQRPESAGWIAPMVSPGAGRLPDVRVCAARRARQRNRRRAGGAVASRDRGRGSRRHAAALRADQSAVGPVLEPAGIPADLDVLGDQAGRHPPLGGKTGLRQACEPPADCRRWRVYFSRSIRKNSGLRSTRSRIITTIPVPMHAEHGVNLAHRNLGDGLREHPAEQHYRAGRQQADGEEVHDSGEDPASGSRPSWPGRS